MFQGDDKETFHSLRLLRDVAEDKTRPIIFWVGAGASAWCGYPLWEELAGQLHQRFLKYEPQYNASSAVALLRERRYPEFFSYCSKISQNSYFSALASAFSARQASPVYGRFVSVLQGIQPCFIVAHRVIVWVKTGPEVQPAPVITDTKRL